MRLHIDSWLCLSLGLLGSVAAAPAPDQAVAAPDNAGPGRASGSPAPQSFKDLQATYVKNTKAALKASGCTEDKITIRKAWDDLTGPERKDYTRAVNCLASKPGRLDKKLAPGARNRLDDFTYIHINQTDIIHYSAFLLPWHRVFVWQMEQALRNECNYKGYMPYWDTGRFADDQSKSPVFDGSDTSLSGDGKYVPNRKSFTGLIPGLVENITLPRDPGSGGGCVTSGPFVDFKISLGPVFVAHQNASNVYGLQANPRCLSRDFSQVSSRGNLSWDKVTTLVQQPSISTFRGYLEDHIHANGHVTIGGEGADPFSTTNDPAFFLLHAQIDRLWALWQGQDIKNRTYLIDGYRTFFGIPLAIAPNVPPSNGTLSDIMDFGVGGKMPIKDGMSPTDNGRCYMYM